jgi:hypothetical protein
MSSFRIRFILAALLAALPSFVLASGDPPELLSYQSYLVDANGVPLGTDGAGNSQPANYDVVFRIYDASSQGTLLWSEQQTITVDNGYFSILLGEGTAFGSEPNPTLSTVFTGIGADERFVSVAVRFQAGGEFTEILPRLRLLTSPYAFLASQARSLVNPDGDPLITADGGDVTVEGSLTTTQPLSVPSVTGKGANLTELNAGNLSSGTVPLARLPGLPASQITSGTISQNRLTSLNANSLVSGTVPLARLPGLPASQITSGRLSLSRLSSDVARTDRFEMFDSSVQIGGSIYLGNENFGIYSQDGVARYMRFYIANPNIIGGYRWDVAGQQVMLVDQFGFLTIPGVLSQGSDRESKEAIESLDGEAILEKVMTLPIYEWNYIQDPQKSRHIGPMAQDFYAAFGLGNSETNLSPSDVTGVTVAALQEMNRKVEAQQGEIEALRRTVSELQEAVRVLTDLQNASQ